MIAEYKMVREHVGMIVPGFIEDGGYFHDKDVHTFVGIVLPETEREYYVPDTLVYLTPTELNIRVLDIHTRYPMSKEVNMKMIVMTNEEVTNMVALWCSKKDELATL